MNALLSLISLLACAPNVPITGQVVDPWGAPMPDTTVVVEGVVERWSTDAQGRFAIDVTADRTKVIAGKAGYMRATAEAPAPDEGTQRAPVSLTLWPLPPQPGFFAVGTKGYLHLEARPIKVLAPAKPGGDALPTVTVPSDVRVPAGTMSFVFQSTVPIDKMQALGLRLSQLTAPATRAKPGRQARSASTSPAQDAPVAERTAASDLPFTMSAMTGKDAWMVTLAAPLAPGEYAWHTANALGTRDGDALARLPPDRLLAWPFSAD